MGKILIAEDDDCYGETLVEYLRDQCINSEVKLVKNGDEVLQHLVIRRENYSLLILDAYMPDNSTTRRKTNQIPKILNELQHHSIHIHIKIITQYRFKINFVDIKSKYSNFESQHYKPLPPNALLVNVLKCLNNPKGFA